jgi:5'-3' exonuclease
MAAASPENSESRADSSSLLLVDGNYFAARASFALPASISNSEGEPVNGTYGFLNTLKRIMLELQPNGVVVAFDPSGPSFRRKFFPNYKAGRVSLPSNFRTQLDYCRRALDVLRIQHLQLLDYEADDLLASLAAKAYRAARPTLIATGDHDAYQLVQDPYVQIIFPKRGLGVYSLLDERDITQTTGVRPDQYVDYASLRGDASDNIPGVPGLGPKTAAALINSYQNLTGVYDNLDELRPALARSLASHEAIVRRNAILMSLVRNIDLHVSFLSAPWREAKTPELRETFSRLGLARLTPGWEAIVASGVVDLPRPLGVTEMDASVERGYTQTRRGPHHVCLVGCSAQKGRGSGLAADVYQSARFRKARRYAELYCDEWRILSGKYGIVYPRTTIEPYNVSLKGMTQVELKDWSARVLNSLLEKDLNPGDRVTILAGGAYKGPLEPTLLARGIDVIAPLSGMAIGKQLHWLEEANTKSRGEHDLDEVYRIMDLLRDDRSAPLLLADCSGSLTWPRRGVYFLLEPDEFRSSSSERRVTRVGTHAVSRGSKSTLWGRLRTHKGLSDGGGSHRSSVLRLHVGAAMMSRSGRGGDYPRWGLDQTATSAVRSSEADLEREVSRYIGGMEVLFLSVDDEPGPHSDRAYIERNLLALLGTIGAQIDPPSLAWLGLQSPQGKIRSSGLWNVNYVADSYDPRVLDLLAYYRLVTQGLVEQPSYSIAPRGWWRREQVHQRQEVLF